MLTAARIRPAPADTIPARHDRGGACGSHRAGQDHPGITPKQLGGDVWGQRGPHEPEELRQRYSDGYRIEVTLPPAAKESAARALGAVAGEVAETPGGLAIRVAALDPPVLAALDRLVAAGARLDIEQPQMTDVFRRVLAASETAA